MSDKTTLRLSFIADTPMPYRVSDPITGRLLGMFCDSGQMHNFLAGIRSGYDGALFNPHVANGVEVEI